MQKFYIIWPLKVVKKGAMKYGTYTNSAATTMPSDQLLNDCNLEAITDRSTETKVKLKLMWWEEF